MPDREKVMQALDDSLKNQHCGFVDGIGDVYAVSEETIKNIIALLKEQETKWIHREDMDFIDKYNCTHFHGMCTNCGLVHDFIDGHTGQYLYCPQCGRTVKWE